MCARPALPTASERVRVSANVVDTISLLAARQVPGVEDIVGYISGRIRERSSAWPRPPGRRSARPRRRRYFSVHDRVRPSLYVRITADDTAALDDLVDTVEARLRTTLHASTGLLLDRVRVTVVDRPTAQRQCALRRRNRPAHTLTPPVPAPRPTPPGPSRADPRLDDPGLAAAVRAAAAQTPGVAAVYEARLRATDEGPAAVLRLSITLGASVPVLAPTVHERLDAVLQRRGRPPLTALRLDVVGLHFGNPLA